MNLILLFIFGIVVVVAGVIVYVLAKRPPEKKKDDTPSDDDDEEPEPTPQPDDKDMDKLIQKCADVPTHRPIENKTGSLCHFLSLMHLFGALTDFADVDELSKYFSLEMHSAVMYVVKPSESTDQNEKNYEALKKLCLNSGKQDSPVNDIDKLYAEFYLTQQMELQVTDWTDFVVTEDCASKLHLIIPFYLSLKYIPLTFEKPTIQQMMDAFMTQKLSENPLCEIQKSHFTALLADKFLLLEYPRGDLKRKVYTKVNVDEFIHINDQDFGLLACVVHIGDSIFSGHYMCVAKNRSGVWVLYDDSRLKCYKNFEEVTKDRSIKINRNGLLYLYQLL